MESKKASWFKRNILYKIPFLYWRRECGNYHPFWERLCYCRMCTSHEIQDLRTGEILSPAADVRFTREVNVLGREYGIAQYNVGEARRKLLQAITFYMNLRDSRANLFKVTDAINEMHCAVDRLVQAENTLYDAWLAVMRFDKVSEQTGKTGCHQDHGPCRARGDQQNPGGNIPRANSAGKE